jgi:hypothetical protein
MYFFSSARASAFPNLESVWTEGGAFSCVIRCAELAAPLRRVGKGGIVQSHPV